MLNVRPELGDLDRNRSGAFECYGHLVDEAISQTMVDDPVVVRPGSPPPYWSGIAATSAASIGRALAKPQPDENSRASAIRTGCPDATASVIFAGSTQFPKTP